MIIKDRAHLFHGFLGDIACNSYPSHVIDELLRFLDDVLVLVQDITEILVRFFEAALQETCQGSLSCPARLFPSRPSGRAQSFWPPGRDRILQIYSSFFQLYIFTSEYHANDVCACRRPSVHSGEPMQYRPRLPFFPSQIQAHFLRHHKTQKSL